MTPAEARNMTVMLENAIKESLETSAIPFRRAKQEPVIDSLTNQTRTKDSTTKKAVIHRWARRSRPHPTTEAT